MKFHCGLSVLIKSSLGDTFADLRTSIYIPNTGPWKTHMWLAGLFTHTISTNGKKSVPYRCNKHYYYRAYHMTPCHFGGMMTGCACVVVVSEWSVSVTC